MGNEFGLRTLSRTSRRKESSEEKSDNRPGQKKRRVLDIDRRRKVEVRQWDHAWGNRGRPVDVGGSMDRRPKGRTVGEGYRARGVS